MRLCVSELDRQIQQHPFEPLPGPVAFGIRSPVERGDRGGEDPAELGRAGDRPSAHGAADRQYAFADRRVGMSVADLFHRRSRLVEEIRSHCADQRFVTRAFRRSVSTSSPFCRFIALVDIREPL